ncbi:MAG: NAD-dependent epimerase/dehydratase family protein [Candidatus Margulisiibacteriota bacterium]
MADILITGANGCIGSYVVDQLLTNSQHDLRLLVRSPDRLREDVRTHPRVSIFVGDLETMADFQALTCGMDAVIHVATAWGDSDYSIELNVRQTHALFDSCEPDRLRRIIYFSTASILGAGNKVVEEAGTLGTGYIRSKYLGFRSLAKSRFYDRIVTVFPTVVFGGDDRHPMSHISGGIMPNQGRIRWLRFIYPDGAFQFMHAADIAKVVQGVLESPNPGKEVVMGGKGHTARAAIREICDVLGIPVYFQIRVPNRFLLMLARWMRIKIHPWDRYCVTHPDFVYDAVTPETFGMASSYPTLTRVVQDIKTRWRPT